MSQEGRRDPIGGVFVAGAALLFGGTVVLGKTDAVQAIPVTSMLTVRFGVAGLALGAVLLVSRRGLRPASGEWRWLLALGGVGYAAESTFFFQALGRGTAATVTLLFYTYPVMVTLISAAFGLGVPGLLLIVSLLSAVAGTALVVGSSGGLDITFAGIWFAFASALTFSVYLVTADQVVRRTGPLASAMWVSLSASVALAAYSAATGNAEVPEGDALLSITAMGLLTAGAFTLLFLGLRRVGAVRTAIIASLEPVAASVLALVFLDEALRGGVLAGGLLILGGAIAASLARGVREPERAVP
ncbi:MAG: DMT family transporter [Actinomycetota bacterium]